MKSKSKTKSQIKPKKQIKPNKTKLIDALNRMDVLASYITGNNNTAEARKLEKDYNIILNHLHSL